jgi:hypothetical protein
VTVFAESRCLLSIVSAALVLFFVDGEVRCRAVGLVLGVALLSVFRLFPVLSSVPSAVFSTGSVAATVGDAHVIRGNECVVLVVWCVWAKNLRFVVCVSRFGADSVVLAFFVARLSSVSAALVLFFVDGEVRCRVVGLVLSVALLSVFRLFPVLSSVPSAVFSTGSVAATVGAAHVIRGNECVVLVVWCLWAKNLRFVVCV